MGNQIKSTDKNNPKIIEHSSKHPAPKPIAPPKK